MNDGALFLTDNDIDIAYWTVLNCSELPSIKKFWIISVYNSPAKPIEVATTSTERIPIVFIYEDPDSLHEELNCS